ncbi:MAG TPA: aminotransferase class I/II-fold pyridoxal phosphate-dependent enzyme [Actinomycetota bacterium]|jgi:aspartate aminotransferase
MAESPVSESINRIATRAMRFFEFFSDYGPMVAQAGPDHSDLVAGNPQERVIAGYGEALRRYSESDDPTWFAYAMSLPEAQEAAAESLNATIGSDYRPEDIHLTNAAMAGLAVTIRAVCDPGDEVIIISPPHFLYEPIIMGTGAGAVRVGMREDDFDLDVDAIGAAITERTRAIIVNSPHNPTGRIYPPSTLRALADVLTAASARNGRTIYLLSDEAYQRIVFDGNRFESPTRFYAPSFLIYTYGKTLLTPGQRLGYVAIRQDMPHREELSRAIGVAQVVNGWMWPNALLQHATRELEGLSVDVARLQDRRDRTVGALRAAGYSVHVPEAAFYLLPRSPIEDDEKFVRMLAEREVFTMPGSLLESPGYFRISLTGSDAMIDRALPVFAQVLSEVDAS